MGIGAGAECVLKGRKHLSKGAFVGAFDVLIHFADDVVPGLEENRGLEEAAALDVLGKPFLLKEFHQGAGTPEFGVTRANLVGKLDGVHLELLLGAAGGVNDAADVICHVFDF